MLLFAHNEDVERLYQDVNRKLKQKISVTSIDNILNREAYGFGAINELIDASYTIIAYILSFKELSKDEHGWVQSDRLKMRWADTKNRLKTDWAHRPNVEFHSELFGTPKTLPNEWRAWWEYQLKLSKKLVSKENLRALHIGVIENEIT